MPAERTENERLWRTLQTAVWCFRIRSAYLAIYVTGILARTPYRYAVGLMIETDEVSEQVCELAGWEAILGEHGP